MNIKNFLSSKRIGFAVFAVVFAAVALFAVMPMLPDIDSASRISFAALIAEGSNTPNAATPTCTLDADPESIKTGESSTITWTTSNAVTVRISQDVGPVSENGSASVSPTESTTYTLTAKNSEGVTVKCKTHVAVTPNPTPAPTCTLKAHPSYISKGESTKLSWTTTDATHVTIDQNIGSVSANGSKNISPSETKTYTLTAKGDGGLVRCNTKVTVIQPNPAPTCTLVAKPGGIEEGESTKLIWTTHDAHTVTIDQGVGGVSDNGSKRVSPSKTTTYTLTAKGGGGTVKCSEKVYVKPAPEPAPTCTLIGKPANLVAGETSSLKWTTTNATKVTIDQGVGQVSENGSRTVSPNKTTIYTLTAKGDGGTVNCSTKIKVEQPIPAPTCTLSPESQTITLGSVAKLSYTVTSADSLMLITKTSDGDEDNETLTGPDGIINKKPDQDTTLTLVAKNTSTGKSVTCEAEITVQQPDAPTCLLTLNKSDITEGDKVRASFEVTGSDHVKITRTLHGTQGRTELENTNATSGSVIDTPPSTGTFIYRVVATGQGGEAECKDRVVVNALPQPDPLTCDAFSASPNNLPVGGGDITLTWETSNAATVSIDNGVGNSLAVDGTETVTVTDDTTFTLTASRNSESVTCDTTVTVEDGGGGGGPNLSCDAFSASPNNLPVGGGDTTLSWDTTDATAVSIDNGIGDVDLDGNTVVNVTDDTTFTLTASRGGETVACDTTVTVADDNQTPTVSCDAFSASPSSHGVGGGNTTLTWETSNATNVSINNGVGDNLDLDGNATIDVTETTTYTLTASDDDNNDVTCNVAVSVDTGGGGGGGGGGSSRPRCDLFEVSESLPNGDIVLHWETSRGTDMKIEPGVLETSDNDFIDEGFATVTPQTNVRYVLTVERGSRDDTCTLDTAPDITVITDRQPITSLSLTQIPYTGFEAGPMLTGLFYTMLVLWSLAIAYVLVIQRGTVFGFSLARRQEAALHVAESVLPHSEYRQSVALQEKTHAVETPTEIPSNLPTGSFEDTQPVYGYQSAVDAATEEDDTYLENHAHEKQALLSSDAIRMIQDTEDDPKEQIALLDTIVDRAKESYPREDGWLVINRQRISELLGQTSEPKERVQPVVSEERTDVTKMTHSLTEAIVTGNIAAAYQCLGSEPMLALANAASDLDQLYRARRGNTEAGEALLQKAAHLSDRQLEGAIEALVSAIDGTYSDEAAAVKLAIVKAVKAAV